MQNQPAHRLMLAALTVAALAIGGWFLARWLARGDFTGPRSHDFGIVEIYPPETVVEHVFALANEGDASLRVVEAAPNCGCTTARVPLEPIAPGETLEIPVSLRLRHSRSRDATVRIAFDDGAHVVLRVRAIGRMAQPMYVRPLPLSVVSQRSAEGMLGIEWFAEGDPPPPTFDVPEGITIAAGPWRIERAARPLDDIPRIMGATLTIAAASTPPPGTVFTVHVEGAPPLVVVMNEGVTDLPVGRVPGPLSSPIPMPQ
jgi:hypothetical protein